MGFYKTDFYAQKAKKEGFVARSVYKLQEIQKKFGIFKKDMYILDLGAAPGSWSQYVLRVFSPHTLVAVDLQSLSTTVLKQFTHTRHVFIQGDFTLPKFVREIKSLGPYDGVICDAAPTTTGNRTVDTAASENLVEAAFSVTKAVLNSGGFFINKIFEGDGLPQVLKCMNNHFGKISRYTPKVVRSQSFEQYIVCRDSKGFNNI